MDPQARDPPFFDGRGCQSGSGGTFQPNVERKVVSLFHGNQYLSFRQSVASTRGRLQCHPSSCDWDGSQRRDVEQRSWKRLYGKWLKQKPVRPKFQVGDRVRLNKGHRIFEKGYLPGWTEEVFSVH